MNRWARQPWAKRILRIGLTGALCAAFFVASANWGPLAKLDEIGGWEKRRIFLAMVSGGLFFALLPNVRSQKGWGAFAFHGSLLFLGALLRLYALDSVSPYYAGNLTPVFSALRGGFEAGAAQGNAYTPLTLGVFRLMQGTQILPKYMIKLTSIVGDLMLAQILCGWVERRKASALWGTVALVGVLFCPSLFLIGAYGATMDSVYLCFALLSLSLGDKKKWVLSGVCFGVAYALCPYALAIVPGLLFCAGREDMVKIGVFAPLTCALTSIPTVLAGMPFTQAVQALTLRGRNVAYLQKNSASVYTYFAQPLVEDTPQYHMMRHLDVVKEGELINTGYTMALLQPLRTAGFALFLMLLCVLCYGVYKNKKALRQEADTVLVFFALFGALFLPGVDAGAFLLPDICVIVYALMKKNAWRLALVSLSASCICAIAFVTSVPAIPLWLCMSAQMVVLLCLGGTLLKKCEWKAWFAHPQAPHRV